MPIDNQLANIGMTGIALFLIIKEGFNYLRMKNNKGGESINQQLLEAITDQNDNHLKAIEKSLDKMGENINTGNDRVVDAIKGMHTDLASRLGELKGKLDK